MLNIPSTVVDPTYRYRMPKMQLKIESKGNGIKTNIVNLPDIAKHLRTDQTYILKFFGFEKASQTIEKASENKSSKAGGKSNTSYIIQGSFADDQLLKTLDKFIQKYILCPRCKLPQMNMYIINEKINGKCDSCPFNGEIDNKHKIASYIVKNPPSYKPQAIKPTKIIQNQEKTEQKSEKLVTNGKNQQEKKEQEKLEEASKLFQGNTIEFGSPQLDKLVEYTRKYIESKKKQDFDIASAETVQNLKPLNLKKTLMAYVIFNALFTVNIAKQVQENSPMFKKLMKRLVGSSDQYNELQTLLNLQYLFLEVNKEKDFAKYIPTILNKLLQNEIFSKAFLLKWSNSQIKDIDKLFLYNDVRNEKFLSMSTDFIEYIKDDSDEEAQSG